MRRLWAALMMVAAAVLFLPRPASAAPGSASGSGHGVQLLAQTPWVQTSGQFGLRVQISAASPATDEIALRYFPQLHNRTNFDAAATGKMRSYPFDTVYQPVSKLSADPAGGFDIQIPVNTPAPAGSPFPEFATGSVTSGVYPLQVSVVDASHHAEGRPLTTFLVYASSTVNPLSVSVVVPVDSGPTVASNGKLTGPAPAEATRLSRLASVLDADRSVHAGLLTLPRTLTALQNGAAAGSAPAKAALSALEAVPQSGMMQVLPSTYSPVSPGDLIGAGLGEEANQQVDTGTAVLKSVYGTDPGARTWVVNGPLDAATAGFLASRRVTDLIVPNSDLSPYNNTVTFASATWLQSGYSRFKVVAADPQLSADFSADEPPVLAANHLLAELAMIQTEAPSNSRGVVAMPPPGWHGSPELISTLLDGLNANPLLRSVTPSGLFKALPSPEVTRQLANPDPAPGRAANALSAPQTRAAIQTARRDVSGLSSLLTDQATLTTLGDQLLTAESADIGSGTRNALIGAVEAEKKRLTGRISLPGSTAITLTATKGQLPITILSAGAVHAKVQLELTSQKLIFKPAGLPGGSCQVPIPTREICTFTLQAQNTTLHVPVETRSSGVFPLVIDLKSANGVLSLARNRDTVRSTAVSGVGVILIVVAVVSLAIWWGRDLRHGRRPRRLSPAPDTDAAEDVEIGDDPVVQDFFQSEPPQFDGSGRRTG